MIFLLQDFGTITKSDAVYNAVDWTEIVVTAVHALVVATVSLKSQGEARGDVCVFKIVKS